jgi:hypothetical protein
MEKIGFYKNFGLSNGKTLEEVNVWRLEDGELAVIVEKRMYFGNTSSISLGTFRYNFTTGAQIELDGYDKTLPQINDEALILAD